MSIRLAGNPRKEWRSHWPVVLAASICMAMSTMNSFSTGVFIQPLQDAFGWSRAAISLGPAITAPLIVVLGPFMGAAIDRFGPRRIGIIGVTLLFTVNILLSLTGPQLWTWYAVWALVAVANLFIQPSVWTAAVSSFFSAGRGFALALTMSGSGIGSLITPYLTFQLIAHYGWRAGFMGLAIFWGLVTIPLMLWLFTSAQDRARTRDRQPTSRSTLFTPAGRNQLFSIRFFQLAFAGLLIAAVVISMVMNLVPVLSSNGLSREAAASVAPLLGLSSIAGRLLIGYLLDRLPGTILSAVSVCLPIATAMLLLHIPGSVPAAAAAVLILGFALGAELDLVAYLTSRYFGLANFGLLFGTIGGLITLAGAVAPLAMNMVYDATQSYSGALWAYVPMCLTSALLFLFLGPYPPLSEVEPSAVSDAP